MSGNVVEFSLLLLIAFFTAIAAIFATLSFFRTRPQASGLDEQSASRILRSETDIVRGAIDAQGRGLREELGRILTGFQEVTLTTFGTMRDGIDAQVRGFGPLCGFELSVHTGGIPVKLPRGLFPIAPKVAVRHRRRAAAAERDESALKFGIFDFNYYGQGAR